MCFFLGVILYGVNVLSQQIPMSSENQRFCCVLLKIVPRQKLLMEKNLAFFNLQEVEFIEEVIIYMT